MKTKKIMFTFDRPTKNTAKFDEVVEEGKTPIIGSLYVRKDFLASMGPGTQARVTLEVQEGGQDHFKP